MCNVCYRNRKGEQYGKNQMERELHKCYMAFAHGQNAYVPQVATGNWGCGVFNGDREFKFLLQWLAASIHDRPKMRFHTIGDTAFQTLVQETVDAIQSSNVTVKSLFNCLLSFDSVHKKYEQKGVFKYVKKKLCK